MRVCRAGVQRRSSQIGKEVRRFMPPLAGRTVVSKSIHVFVCLWLAGMAMPSAFRRRSSKTTHRLPLSRLLPLQPVARGSGGIRAASRRRDRGAQCRGQGDLDKTYRLDRNGEVKVPWPAFCNWAGTAFARPNRYSRRR